VQELRSVSDSTAGPLVLRARFLVSGHTVSLLASFLDAHVTHLDVLLLVRYAKHACTLIRLHVACEQARVVCGTERALRPSGVLTIRRQLPRSTTVHAIDVCHGSKRTCRTKRI
jgi:hypothetical protein